nr:hypothetical protein [uncultured Oscillibacter sp.]
MKKKGVCKIKKIKKLTALLLTLVMSLALAVPCFAAEPNDSEPVVLPGYVIDGRDKTSEEIDQEITDYINSLVDSLSGTARVQTYYRAVSLSPVRDSVTGFPGNQKPEGYRLGEGGFLYYSEDGGPEATITLSLALAYGPASFSLGVSVPMGNRSNGTIGLGVPVPDSVNYYKLKVTKNVEIHPIAIYEVDRPNAPLTRDSRLAYVSHTQTVMSVYARAVKA